MPISRFVLTGPLRHVVFGASALALAVGCTLAISWAFAHTLARNADAIQAAVASSPHNSSFWVGLGQARERAGDRPAAESAYRRALELAPNYARTKWALGNN